MNKRDEQALLRWWQSMMLPDAVLRELNIAPAPSKYRAELRRTNTLSEAALTEAFSALWFSLSDELVDAGDADDVACWAAIAQILAYVTSDVTDNLAQAAGHVNESGRPAVSAMRFMQLASAREPEEFVRGVRRIIRQLHGAVAVVTLANDVVRWFAEQQKRHLTQNNATGVGVQWSMDYYQASKKKVNKP